MAKRQEIPKSEYLKGLNEAVDNIQEAVDNMIRGSAQGLANALFYVATESQQRAPIETGDLRGSIEVKIDGEDYAYCKEYRADKGKTTKDGGKKERKNYELTVEGTLPDDSDVKETGEILGEVSYNTKYAANQHEHTEYYHENGQAKYLESVLVEEKDRILKLIAEGVINETMK